MLLASGEGTEAEAEALERCKPILAAQLEAKAKHAEAVGRQYAAAKEMAAFQEGERGTDDNVLAMAMSKRETAQNAEHR
jgi:hypothetical protein